MTVHELDDTDEHVASSPDLNDDGSNGVENEEDDAQDVESATCFAFDGAIAHEWDEGFKCEEICVSACADEEEVCPAIAERIHPYAD